MKRFVLLAVLFQLAAVSSLQAQSKPASSEFEYKKKGFFLGGELAGLVGFGDGDVFGAPGKLDLLAGYQINPYISVAADLWTFWFIAYAAEANVKANFTDSKISPYAVGTIGVVKVISLLDEDEPGGAALTYSAGLGADFHLWKQGTLFAELKYRGGSDIDNLSVSVNGVEAGVGFRWVF